MPKTICIAASGSKVGKTTMIVDLIPRLPGWAVCKLTTCLQHAGGKCPRGKDHSCGICHSYEGTFTLEEREGIIREPDTDTGRYSAAGAAKVMWVLCRPEYLESAVSGALEKLSGYPGILFEGNHVLEVFQPDASVLIRGERGMKASARAIIDRVERVIAPGDVPETIEALANRFAS